jgi:predicted HTH transcriptional regulator
MGVWSSARFASWIGSPRSKGVDQVRSNPSDEELEELTNGLVALPQETEWVEFKENNADPDEIGEYISALSNSAALEGRHSAYLMWGVRDSDHVVVGTTFDPVAARAGQEELQNYLLRWLSPQVQVTFHQFVHSSGQAVVILEVEAANSRPIAFKSVEYVRIGSYKKKMRDHPDHERRLWRLFDNTAFEHALAAENQSVEDIVQRLDYAAYYKLVGSPLPENRSLIIETLQSEGFVVYDAANQSWGITNRGALLLAVNLSDFSVLDRKAPRVVLYRGTSRVETVREQVGRRGYAAGFSGLVQYVADLLPEREVIESGIRSTQSPYPELAVRELLANALVHQDLTIRGAGPMIEIFDDRLEITNPGVPLVEPQRFIDGPPQSRNEATARTMRQLGICEERGSGWDKITFSIELHQLPPPLVEVTDVHTRVVLFASKALSGMSREDRIRAVYQHACLKYVNREQMTNATLRQRFGIADRNSAQASRLIRETVDAGLIAPFDPSVGAKAMRYVPFWADPRRTSIA